MNFSDKKVFHNVDICIIGGGMSGICAAVAAARRGCKVALMHDRPVLGGNASSEIRMWIRGASGKENRETGILQEIEFENIYRNPTLHFSVWDTVLYGIVRNEKNIELLLNTSCLGCEAKDNEINSVTGWQLNSYTFHTVNAKIFIDSSGDSILAPISGAKYRVGRESCNEFDEYGDAEESDSFTMGSSVLLQARETDHMCTFKAPEWAYKYEDDESLNLHAHNVGASGNNFWWIEFGGQLDTINDAQKINEELVKITYGIWDHLKNHGDHNLDNWELEWIGFLPGKRESRRYEGPYMLNQKDLEEGHHFEDTVAFGGWTMDNHSPLGFYYKGYSSKHIAVKVPYEIPFCCLYSKNIKNLMFAGRNISVSHMAMSSTRVMATCAVIGQASGTGAAFAVRNNCYPEDVDKKHIREVQNALLDDGCYIPNLPRLNNGKNPQGLDEQRIKVLRNTWERPHNGEENSIKVSSDETVFIETEGNSREYLRVVWDTDYSRDSITNVEAYQKFAMRSHIVKDFEPLKMPSCLMKSCDVVMMYGNGKTSEIKISENHKPMLLLPIPGGVVRVSVKNIYSWSDEKTGIFSFDTCENLS